MGFGFRRLFHHLRRELSCWMCTMGRLSGSQRNELWNVWEAGESQRSIARALERSSSTIRTQLLSPGGNSTGWISTRELQY